MNLPFSPTFFQKIEVYQQLIGFESQMDKKKLWEGEKAVLLWAQSERHQHLGSAINQDCIKDAIIYCSTQPYFEDKKIDRFMNDEINILRNLLSKGFGTTAYRNPDQVMDLVINNKGLLAGQILVETNNLQNNSKYERYIKWWWIFLYLGVIVLVGQAVGAISSTFLTLVGLIKWIIELFSKF